MEREAELERQIAELRESIHALTAKLRGAQAELEALREGNISGSLASLERTDAILTVLRSVDVSLSPTAILEQLVEAGRPDQLNQVTATLKYLLDQGKVDRRARGRYSAT